MTLGEASSRNVAGLSATELVQWLFVFVWIVEESMRLVSIFFATSTEHGLCREPFVTEFGIKGRIPFRK
jgi:hypothetical protein